MDCRTLAFKGKDAAQPRLDFSVFSPNLTKNQTDAKIHVLSDAKIKLWKKIIWKLQVYLQNIFK